MQMIWGFLGTLWFISVVNAQTCILTPELTVGPYYYDIKSVRRNITEGKPGIPLNLQIQVHDNTSCKVIAGAAVDIWHCDAGGHYSHFDGTGNGTSNTTYLRGVQLSNALGSLVFDSIYPGWYEGRNTHIHIRVRLGGSESTDNYQGGHIVHTGQLFFNDSANAAVALIYPYNLSTTPLTPNDQDFIYNEGGSDTLLLIKFTHPEQGYAGGVTATITLLVNSSANFSDTDGPPGPPPPSWGAGGGGAGGGAGGGHGGAGGAGDQDGTRTPPSDCQGGDCVPVKEVVESLTSSSSRSAEFPILVIMASVIGLVGSWYNRWLMR